MGWRGCGRSRRAAKSNAFVPLAGSLDALFRRAPSVCVRGCETEAAEGFHASLSADGEADGRAGGFTFCMSGPHSAQAHGAYARSRSRRIGPHEFVLVHCNSYAGGYWTDVTRTYCLGEPEDRMRKMYDAVFAARAAALDALRPGVYACDVDAAARGVLRDRGFGAEFKHSTGHGVGFEAISPNALPRLHPKSNDVLQPGMVFNVEPAVYYDGYGGLRHCDLVALAEQGGEVLTPFHASPAELSLAALPAPA